MENYKYILVLVWMCACTHQPQVTIVEQSYIRTATLPVVNTNKIQPPIQPVIVEEYTITEPDPEPINEYTPVIPNDEWNDTTKLWLARSMIGEVGWLRPAEQSAIAWIYAVRAHGSSRYDFIGMVKQYSAAVRTPGKQRNPWLFELGFNRIRPQSWPNGPLWTGLHDNAWIAALELADQWQRGEIPNPCPRANHFGGYVDRHRAEAMRWTRVKCTPPSGSKKFRNRFYDSRRLR